MYLIDTNIWLENLLDQDRAKEVKEFLNNVKPNQLYISDFALHSIVIILTKLKKYDTFIKFLDDLFVDNIGIKRPGNGISPMRWYEILGNSAQIDYKEDDLV